MSISWAPVAAPSPASSAFSPRRCAPDGNPATAATQKSMPATSRAATRAGVQDTRAAVGAPGVSASARSSPDVVGVASGPADVLVDHGGQVALVK